MGKLILKILSMTLGFFVVLFFIAILVSPGSNAPPESVTRVILAVGIILLAWPTYTFVKVGWQKNKYILSSLTSTFLTVWRWPLMYKFTLGVVFFVAWLAVVYLFGLSAWLPQLVLFALLGPLILVALKYRLLGILVIIISLSFGLSTLFWWQSSASLEATAQVVDKPTGMSGTAGSGVAPRTHYYLLLALGGTGKVIEVAEDTYESIDKYERLTIRYHKEVFGTGHWEHTVVESIGKGIVLDGGGRRFGSPGSNVIGGGLILIASGIGVLGLIPSIMTRPQKTSPAIDNHPTGD